jgi:hypothetical protein
MPTVTFESFVKLTLPYRKRRVIYFVEGSEASTVYGKTVYGCFVFNKLHKLPEAISLEDQFVKIDAQVLNGYNGQLGDRRMTLFYKGVHFDDIDLNKSFPEFTGV